MNRPVTAAYLLTAALLYSTAAVWAAPAFDLGTGEYMPEEILVQFKDASSRVMSIDRWSGNEIDRLEPAGLSLIGLREGQSVEDAIAEYGSDPNVAHVQPNYIYRLSALPNDPFFTQMWGLRNTGQTVVSAPPTRVGSPTNTNNPGAVGSDMNMAPAWDLLTDCSAVTVAIIDSGINYNHDDLAANVWSDASGNHGYNFVDDNNNPLDRNGHGTHVAGTIGAVGNNGVGTTGVCWKAKLMSVRSCDATGSCTTANNVKAVDFAVTNGAKVINMSLGGRNFDQAFSDAILRASNSDVVVVAAAGNEGANNDVTPSFPCNFPQRNVVCVAALDQSFALASFSNYGQSSVHVGAPGVNVLSSWAGSPSVTNDDFHSGPWTRVPTTGWMYQQLTIGGQTLDVLLDPSTYAQGTGTFIDGDRVFKTFSLGGAISILLNIAGQVTLAPNGSLDVNISTSPGDPFTGPNRLIHATGSTSTVLAFPTLDITRFSGPTVSIGFKLNGPPPPVGGAAIVQFAITSLQQSNSTYNIIAGTSMATPHVAGLAALLRAYNPSYTAPDVVNSIKGGGTPAASLAGKTVTGKAANALGSLAYINAPTGVTAAVAQ